MCCFSLLTPRVIIENWKFGHPVIVILVGHYVRGVSFSRDDLALLQMEGFHWQANAGDVVELL